MAQDLLTLIQRAARGLSLTVPTGVVSSTDQQVLELLEAANQAGNMLVKDFNWQRLSIEHVFETTAKIELSGNISAAGVITGLSSTASLSVGMIVEGTGVQTWAEIASVDSGTQVTLNLSATAGNSITFTFLTQDYAMPADYDRMLPDTQWDRENYWRNVGSLTAQSWGYLKGGTVSTGVRYRWRIYKNKLRLTPAPTDKLTQSFEYISNYWIIASGATDASKSLFTADTDTTVFDDLLMVYVIQVLWRQSKALDITSYQALATKRLQTCKAQDVPGRTLNLAGTPYPTLLSESSIPDSGYGS